MRKSRQRARFQVPVIPVKKNKNYQNYRSGKCSFQEFNKNETGFVVCTTSFEGSTRIQITEELPYKIVKLNIQAE